jgi:hypothetical protein
MRNIPMPIMESDEAEDNYYNNPMIANIDCRERAYDTLLAVDEVLQQLGYQIGMYDTGSTDFMVTVEKVEK